MGGKASIPQSWWIRHWLTCLGLSTAFVSVLKRTKGFCLRPQLWVHGDAGGCLLGAREVPGCCAYVCEDWKLKLTGSDSQCRKDVAFKKGQGKAVSESPPRHISSIASLQVSVGWPAFWVSKCEDECGPWRNRKRPATSCLRNHCQMRPLQVIWGRPVGVLGHFWWLIFNDSFNLLTQPGSNRRKIRPQNT